jgi:choline dehydrogenase-like flavoprotein
MSSIEADYVVVGGGLCGVVVASLLSRSSKNPEVILLEAGSDPQGEPNTDTILNGLRLLGGKFDYAYRSQPVSSTFNRVHTLNAGKALGGGTILNLAGWLRADAADYDEWSKIVGDSRWSYGVFKAYLERVEKTMQVSPVSSDPERRYPLRDPVAKAWTEIGALGPEDKDAGSIEGLQEMKENTLNGLRQPSYAAFPLDKVKVYSDTTVNKVLFAQKEEGKKPVAIGVQLASGQQIIARKEVILSAGAYRTPQLLLLSGIGDRNALAHHGTYHLSRNEARLPIFHWA